MKFFRRLRKKLGIYTAHEVGTTYANAVQHGRDLPKDISDKEMVEKGTKMLEDWMKALEKF